MDVQELWEATSWIQTQVVAKQIQEQFAGLGSILTTNTQPNQPRQAFEGTRDTLLAALRTVDLWVLTEEQKSFLEKVMIYENVGEHGARKVEDILFRNAIDIATAAGKINTIASNIRSGIDRSIQIRNGIEGLISPSPKLIADEVLLRVTFCGNARITNVVELKEWAAKWQTIGRGIAMANNAAPEDFRIVGAGTGSIIIELAVVPVLAKTVSFIILEALKVADRVLAILKQVEELKALRLSNKKIAKELKEEADGQKTAGIDEISQKALQYTGLDPKQEGDKVTALRAAVKTLIEFATDGGKVDCVLPPIKQESSGLTDDLETPRKELEENFVQIRKLEAQQRRIEFSPEVDPE